MEFLTLVLHYRLSPETVSPSNYRRYYTSDNSAMINNDICIKIAVNIGRLFGRAVLSSLAFIQYNIFRKLMLLTGRAKRCNALNSCITKISALYYPDSKMASCKHILVYHHWFICNSNALLYIFEQYKAIIWEISFVLVSFIESYTYVYLTVFSSYFAVKILKFGIRCC